MINVIATGSKGNAVLYHNSILIDCGVPFAFLKKYLFDIKLILLTHVHKDHFNRATVSRMMTENPSLRVGCCDWFEELHGNRIDKYKISSTYDYGSFQVSPFLLYHDVQNCGYRIFKGDIKIFHATDTAHLEGIEAKGYDVYAIERNYDEDTIIENIQRVEEEGRYAYQRFSINRHLSAQQANEFYSRNKKDESVFIELHKSTNF